LSAPPTVQRLLLSAFRRNAANTCLVWEGGSASYAETEQRVAAIASWLQDKTPPEAHIAILLPNSRAYLEVILACAAAGRVRVPLNPREPPEAQLFKIDQSDASALVVDVAAWEELRGKLGSDGPRCLVVGDRGTRADSYDAVVQGRSAGDLSPVSSAMERYRLSYTGGTTGAPKAVVTTHVGESAMIRNLLLEAVAPKQSAVFVASTPLAHASGAFVVPTVLAGGILSWTDGFDPELLAEPGWLGDELQVQTFVVPTALADLAEAVGPTSRFERVIYGGAPCTGPVLERAINRIGQRLIQVYGQAEAPMTICVLSMDGHESPGQLGGCVGMPFLFVDVTVESAPGVIASTGEIGEVVVRAEHVMAGYWRNREASAEKLGPDGSLRTQDTGYLDERGRLWLAGRSRELVISGGYNVYPAEVEKRLASVDGVKDVVIFGVPHQRWGEAVVAAVVMSDPADESGLRERLGSTAKRALASYERPKAIVMVAELPTTVLGKVSRKELSARFADLFESDRHHGVGRTQ
jgi:long-chain acyl-CoA synthetase